MLPGGEKNNSSAVPATRLLLLVVDEIEQARLSGKLEVLAIERFPLWSKRSQKKD